jgi:hypothetical protein
MSSHAYPVQAVTTVRPIPSPQQDDEAVLQMFAALGSFYESTAKLHHASSQGKINIRGDF